MGSVRPGDTDTCGSIGHQAPLKDFNEASYHTSKVSSSRILCLITLANILIDPSDGLASIGSRRRIRQRTAARNLRNKHPNPRPSSRHHLDGVPLSAARIRLLVDRQHVFGHVRFASGRSCRGDRLAMSPAGAGLCRHDGNVAY